MNSASPVSALTASPSTARWWVGQPWFWLVFAAFLYTPLIDTEPNPGNVASDLAAIESLVERHTFAIDNSTYIDTIDKFRIDGHYYSQKSPIFHLLAALPYAVAHAGGLSFARQPGACVRILTFFMVILPMGWLLWLIYDHPWLRRRGPRAQVLLAGGFALGSLMTPFAVTFNHYVLASACLMMAVRAMTNNDLTTQSPAGRFGLWVGLWIAASLACDVPPAFLFGAGLCATWGWQWLGGKFVSQDGGELARGSGRRLLGLLAGILTVLLVYGALNYRIAGSPLPINTFNLEAFEFEGSYWAEVRSRAEAGHPGYYQASYPRRLLHATLGHKGVYWMMPPLAMATLAAVWLARRRRPGWQLAMAWALFLPLTITLAMRWAFDLSGGAYVIRHALATIAPLYCVLGHPDLPRPRRAMRRLIGAGFLWGCLVAGIGLLNPWSHNTLSAWPPLENIARLCLRHPDRLPTGWIAGLVQRTSVEPATGWLDLGLALFSGNPASPNAAQAENALKRSIALNPENSLSYYYLGILQDQTRRPGAAILTYERLLQIDPKNVGAWNNLGRFALNSGRWDLAEKAFFESLRLAPDNASALIGLLTLDLAFGRLDLQSPRLRRALELYPQDPRLQRIRQEIELRTRP